MNAYSDHKLINHTSMVVLFGRILLFVELIILQAIGGFSGQETWMIIYILGPLTVLYGMAFGRFMVRFPYTVEKLKVGRFSGGASMVFSCGMLLIYLVGIGTNALYKSVLPFQSLVKMLFVGELLNAIFIAGFLSFLFESREKNQPN